MLRFLDMWENRRSMKALPNYSKIILKTLKNRNESQIT